MKKMFFVMAMLLFLSFLISCEKEDSAIKDNQNNEVLSNNTNSKLWVYWCTWSEWGHGGSCGGWGLCGYDDCWFCDVSDRPTKHTGKVVYDSDTKQGYMTIELDPNETIQKTAINGRLSFPVDADINNSNSVLRKGNYAFDPLIGKYGGYKLNITIK